MRLGISKNFCHLTGLSFLVALAPFKKAYLVPHLDFFKKYICIYIRHFLIFLFFLEI